LRAEVHKLRDEPIGQSIPMIYGKDQRTDPMSSQNITFTRKACSTGVKN